jgi:NDP-4-keto-2,6-dideoxyhexose 3-C-methyltransferase
MYKIINACRICGNTELIPVVNLGEQYLTGVFPRNNAADTLTKGPLSLVKCHGGEDCCGLLQLEHSYELSEMYGDNYGYRSGLNDSMVRHLRQKVERILARSSLSAGDLVVDIGSNDGTTLMAYPQNLKLVGIDPTGAKFSQYYASHIDLISDFFSADLINKAFPGKKAKVITSFSMFYDLESPVEFAKQIACVLDSINGIWIFEQSYMPTMLERTAYDTICHEHLEFYALKQIAWIMDKAGLKIIDVEINNINGGSFSVVAAHIGSKFYDVNRVAERLFAQEDAAKLSTLNPYASFSTRIEESRINLRNFVAKAKREGKRICGLGASTKGNVILQHCGFDASDIESIADVNPEKFGSLTPGTWIPIQDEVKVLASNPDYLLVLPWHFRDFFVGNPKIKGRKMVFPLPKIEMVQP